MATKKFSQKLQDAITLLIDDHKHMKALFENFNKYHECTYGDFHDLKQEIMDAACTDFKIYARIKEEIFYPAIQKTLPIQYGAHNVAQGKHDVAKKLVAQIEGGSAANSITCKRFAVLGATIDQYTLEEENTTFAELRKTNLNLISLGREMSSRKNALKAKKRSTRHGKAAKFAANGVEKPSWLRAWIQSLKSHRAGRYRYRMLR